MSEEKQEEIVEIEEIEGTEEIEFEIIDYDINEAIEEDREIKAKRREAALQAQKPQFNLKKEIFSWVKMILTAVILAVVITRFVIINANVPTESMENTIPAKSRIMGFRLSYLFSEPERGDVVVFEYQFAEDTSYVKRIIGLPGETVVIRDGRVEIYEGDRYVMTLNEMGYLKDTDWSGDYTFEVPEGRYLVLGDNRNNSADARYWYDTIYKAGNCKYEDVFVSEDAILGKVYFTYWPNFSFIND